MGKRTCVYVLCWLVLLPGWAAAAVAITELPFGDTSPSWGTDFDGKDFNGVSYGDDGFAAWAPSPWTPYVALPTVDENGTPILKDNDSNSGEHKAVVNGTNLTAITIQYHNDGNPWGTLKPGDLFIDTDGQYGFDYVARTPYFDDGTYFDTKGNPVGFDDSSWTLYSLDNLQYREDLGEDGGPYQLANDASAANGQSWAGNYWVRNYHPWALKADYVTGDGPNDGWDGLTPIGTVGFSGWENLGNMPTGESTWTFGNGGIPLDSDEFRIGWTVNCANDVLLSQVSVPTTHLPEPGSLAIWGLLGLVSALAATRKLERREVGFHVF